MVIYVVGDEQENLDSLSDTLQRAAPEASVSALSSAEAVTRRFRQAPPDVVFLDIRTAATDSAGLVRQVKSLVPPSAIRFFAGCSVPPEEGGVPQVSTFLLAPATQEQLRTELDSLCAAAPGGAHGPLRVQCFGSFEVFIDNSPLQFHYSKTKELLAYLVDRCGAMCTKREIINVLWEGAGVQEKNSYYANLRADLFSTLRGLDACDTVICQRGKLGLRVDRVNCDYYDWLERKAGSASAFRGEYMCQYSWSERTLGQLITESRTV